MDTLVTLLEGSSQLEGELGEDDDNGISCRAVESIKRLQ